MSNTIKLIEYQIIRVRYNVVSAEINAMQDTLRYLLVREFTKDSILKKRSL